MIIDDEVDFTRLIKSNLEMTGKYEVKTENRGPFGLVAAKEFKPDLILLDVMMQGADGGDVCSWLNNDDATKKIPVIFLTAIVNKEEVKESGGIIGGHRFIAKPVDTEKLIEIIDKNI